jgi:branched-chain amino acid transport system ATP-binding protein
MAEKDDKDRVHLRVDRLAAAMDAARARARAETAAPGSPPSEGRPDQTEADDPGDQARADQGTAARPMQRSGAGTQASGAPDAAAKPDIPADKARDDDDAGSGPLVPPKRAGMDAQATPARSGAAPVRPPPLLLTPDLKASAGPAQPVDRRAAARARQPSEVNPQTIIVPAQPAAPEPPRAAAETAALLRLSAVATDIGRYRVLDDVTFDVPRGAVTMLLGRNGAGKTTTLRTVMGLWRARAGEIIFAGDRIDRWTTHRIARAGVGYVPESMSIFGDLTVAENIALGARGGPVARDRLDWLTGLFPPLATFWRAPAGNLSGGQKQMLALARALVEKRRLYLIDEPTKGLAPVVVDTVVAALRDLKLQGATILMVEQNFAVARALGEACAVIDDGRVVWSGSMTALADDLALQTRLMGLNLGDAA